MKVISTFALAAGMALGQDVVQFDQNVSVAGGAPRAVTFFRGGASIVKGAPYSAESVTEHVQTLADGNRITQTNRSSFARDSEGRTRRETTIAGLGKLGTTDKPIVSIFIDDPVAGVHYNLDSQHKVAMKGKSEGPSLAGPAKIAHEKAGTIHIEEAQVLNKISKPAAVAIAGSAGFATAGAFSISSKFDGRSEDLGTRNIEGVMARGTRNVMTIPAGDVGNEKPIEVITETWFSDEIKAVVLSRHSDPRSGEMTTRLQNVRLGDPPRSQFEPPADYKVEEALALKKVVRDSITVNVKEDR